MVYYLSDLGHVTLVHLLTANPRPEIVCWLLSNSRYKPNLKFSPSNSIAIQLMEMSAQGQILARIESVL